MFMLTVICLLLAIRMYLWYNINREEALTDDITEWGGIKYDWQNARIIILLVLALLLCVSFVFLQIKLGEKATVPPRIFKIRSIWVACAYCCTCA